MLSIMNWKHFLVANKFSILKEAIQLPDSYLLVAAEANKLDQPE